MIITTILGLTAQAFWLSFAASALGALVLFFSGFGFLRRARLMEDTPTSLIRSAAQGYVELSGDARLMPGPEIFSPLSLTRCVWWRYSVQHLEKNRDKREWVTVEKVTSGELFLICDATDSCAVDPDDARIVPSIKRNWRGPTPRPCRPPDGSWIQFGDYRYFEELILVGDLLYAIGWFRTQGIEQEFSAESQDLRELLAEWKKDQADLLKRFDQNKDGQIDLQEWESVRRAALEQVRAAQVQRALKPDVHVLCKPPDRRPYILSTVTQQALTRRSRIWATLCLALALPMGVYAMLAMQIRGLH